MAVGASLPVELRVHNQGSRPGLTVPIEHGIVAFSALLIREAGYPYSLTFSLSFVLDGPAVINSNDFSVDIGSPSKLVILDDPSFGSAFGGECFTRQPRIAVVDAGGNMIVEDSLLLAIEVKIRNNPSHGALSHDNPNYLHRKVKNGVVQFNSLSIDKAGEGYQLQYSLLQPTLSGFESNKIMVIGFPFTVEIGSAHSLEVIKGANGGFANNQYFFQQPSIAFVDRGMNIVSSHPAVAVQASIVPSLSYGSNLVIDTSDGFIPSIESVTFPEQFVNLSGYKAGPGDVIPILVSFTDEVIGVVDPLSPGMMMSLTLNVHSEQPQTLTEAVVSPISINVRTKQLVFEYKVEIGHSVNGLNYLSTDSLQRNDMKVVDAWGRSTKLGLPDPTNLNSLLSSSNIIVSDAQPTASFVSTSVVSGEYGAGHHIDLTIEFSRNVSFTRVNYGIRYDCFRRKNHQ